MNNDRKIKMLENMISHIESENMKLKDKISELESIIEKNNKKIVCADEYLEEYEKVILDLNNAKNKYLSEAKKMNALRKNLKKDSATYIAALKSAK